MVDDHMPDKVLDKIEEMITFEKFNDAKILIDTGDKLSDYITLKNVVILMAYVIKDDGKLYPQIFLKETILVA